MPTVYHSRSRKVGQTAWKSDIEASELFIAIDNSMELIDRRHRPSDARTEECYRALRAGKPCTIDGTEYDIHETGKDDDQEDDDA